MALSPSQIRIALHEDVKAVTDVVYDEIIKSDSLAINRIPDGGVVDHPDNNELIIYGESVQPFKEYTTMDYGVPADVSDAMNAAGCDGRVNAFTTNVNSTPNNACSGEVLIDFSMGYRRRGYHDFSIRPKTKVMCAKELASRGKAHIRAFFEGMMKSFTRWGMDNFEASLQNAVIRYGEANFSIQTADYFDVTTGGFVAPPQNRFSIHAARQYRQHLIRAGALGPRDMLEIEIPSQDAIDAIRFDVIQKNPNASYSVNYMEDTDGPLRNRKYLEYDGIKMYINETPVKVYFKRTGTTGGGAAIYQAVRVYPWQNEVGEEAGVVARPNHDYDKDYIWCDGIKHRLCVLVFHIDSRSFKRYGKAQLEKPGSAPSSNNYVVEVRDGAYLANETCGNDYNEKFKLVAMHEFRFGVRYPEYSGCIAYVSSRPAGYVIPPCAVTDETVDTNFAGPQVFEGQDSPLACQEAACQEWGKHAGSDGQCVDSITDPVLHLDPCGPMTTSFTGATHQLVLTVRRVGNTSSTSACTYTITNTPGTGLATTPAHYTDVSDTPGSIAWAAGEEEKQIKINITAASGDASLLAFTVQLVDGAGSTLSTCSAAVVSIEDLS